MKWKSLPRRKWKSLPRRNNEVQSHYPGGWGIMKWGIMKWKSLPRRVGNNEVEVTTQEGGE